MLQTFCQYITDQKLFRPSQPVILAVSGGMDSVAMCNLFHQASYPFAIAHCNFQLRDSESDEDEAFAKNLSKKYQVPFFIKHFSTAAYAEKNKISIQMAARDLRYEWFEEILQQEKYDFLATAHHLNDVIETVLLNLTKGTGIHGLHGIKPISGRIVRPLLFADREQIKHYMTQENLSWREDSSNNSLKYQRNLIRHEVIPVLKKINPNLEETFRHTLEKIKAVEHIFDLKVEEVKKAALKEEKNYVSIHLASVKELAEPGILLFELLKPYNFNYEDTLNLLQVSETGKRIESRSHVAVKDREHFIITRKEPESISPHIIEKDQKEYVGDGFSLSFSLEDRKNFKIPASADMACLDFDKLQFPLLLRKWKEGDFFSPLGMSKKKKISDFLIDHKVPLNLKDKVKVLVSGSTIAWVVGWRIDERFRVSEDTEKIFLVKNKNL